MNTPVTGLIVFYWFCRSNRNRIFYLTKAKYIQPKLRAARLLSRDGPGHCSLILEGHPPENYLPPLKSLALMWERTLQDLVRGLRANKKDEARFIAKAVDEIRQEIKSDDMELKAGAVLKLTYVRTSQLSCYLI